MNTPLTGWVSLARADDDDVPDPAPPAPPWRGDGVVDEDDGVIYPYCDDPGPTPKATAFLARWEDDGDDDVPDPWEPEPPTSRLEDSMVDEDDGVIYLYRREPRPARRV